jgi:hypothetical protein
MTNEKESDISKSDSLIFEIIVSAVKQKNEEVNRPVFLLKVLFVDDAYLFGIL